MAARAQQHARTSQPSTEQRDLLFNVDLVHTTIISLLPAPPIETFRTEDLQALHSSSSEPRVQLTFYSEIYRGVRALDPSLDLEQRRNAAMRQQHATLTSTEAAGIRRLRSVAMGLW